MPVLYFFKSVHVVLMSALWISFLLITCTNNVAAFSNVPPIMCRQRYLCWKTMRHHHAITSSYSLQTAFRLDGLDFHPSSAHFHLADRNSYSTRRDSIFRHYQHGSKEERKRPGVYEDSEKRGAFLLVLALLLCAWSFSIPVELRRDHWCFTSQCASNRSSCYDCITFGEWYQKVRDYYVNGGGIQFDFSIEEK